MTASTSLHGQILRLIPWDTRGCGRTLTPRERVLRNVLKRPDGHWEWTAKDGGHDRPIFVVIHYGKQYATTAARAVWFVINGREPEGRIVRECDFRHCVRPDHWSDGGA